MRNFLLFVLTCCSSIISVYAQTGNYFLSHYTPAKDQFDNVCFDIKQDSKGLLYFSTKLGILEFDGREWDLLPAKSAIYSINISPVDEITWAGANGYGTIKPDESGFQAIHVLNDSVQDVFKTLVIGDSQYFLSEQNVFVVDRKSGKTISLKTPEQESAFSGIYDFFGVAYVKTSNSIYKIENDKLKVSKISIPEGIVFTSRIDNNYILATDDNKLFVFSEDMLIRPITVEDQAYIDASVIVAGTSLNRQLLAIGTLRGGVIFINPLNGKTQEIINYSTGLPDNEVFAMAADQNQNVWVAHDYGFTKIAPYMPFKSFSHYKGLEGNLLCANSSKGAVYVGTSLGLFKLEKEDSYDELIYYENILVANTKSSPEKNNVAEEDKSKVESKKGGLFGFLKRKKKEKDKENGNNKVVESVSTPQYQRVKRTKRVLRASNFVFKKVNGIDAKVSHIIEADEKLLAYGLGGLYEINNLKATTILDEPVRFTRYAQRKKQLFISTYNETVTCIKKSAKGWDKPQLINGINDQVNYIFEGNQDELWLCGFDQLYKILVKEKSIALESVIKGKDQSFDKTIGLTENGKVTLVNASGFYQVDVSSKSLVKLDKLPKPSQYFAFQGDVLYQDEHGWKLLNGKEQENNLQLFNLFYDLKFVASDKEGKNTWIISNNSELYKFFGDRLTPYENPFPLRLKALINQEKRIATNQSIYIDQESSAVNFKVIQPDFVDPQGIEFRYILKGMNEEWSEWSAKNSIEFPYLPPGEYTLEVQSKNIFGKVNELKPLAFEVLPPYWKRSWFYGLEFSIFASLVLLSFRLSARYRIVSRVLSLLTIILLIELIQTAIGASISTNSSPVADFFIQVVVAIMVLPVEGYLRNLMLKSLDSSGKFYQFVTPGIPRLKPEEEKFIEHTDND